MPFREPVQPLQDIIDNIDRIERFLAGKGPLDIAEDELTLFASQYALLIISEAARRLGTRRKLCVRVSRGVIFGESAITCGRLTTALMQS